MTENKPINAPEPSSTTRAAGERDGWPVVEAFIANDDGDHEELSSLQVSFCGTVVRCVPEASGEDAQAVEPRDAWSSGDSIHDLIDDLEAGYVMPLDDGQHEPAAPTPKEVAAAKALRELLDFRNSIHIALDDPNLGGTALARIKWLREHTTPPQEGGEPVSMGSALQRVMARLADMLDDDQFKNIEAIVEAAGYSAPEGGEAAPQGAREPLSEIYRTALQNIASSEPSHEAASKTTGSPSRMRCYHCGFAWQPGDKQYHALDCAYMDAVNALAAGRAIEAELRSPVIEAGAETREPSVTITKELRDRMLQSLKAIYMAKIVKWQKLDNERAEDLKAEAFGAEALLTEILDGMVAKTEQGEQG